MSLGMDEEEILSSVHYEGAYISSTLIQAVLGEAALDLHVLNPKHLFQSAQDPPFCWQRCKQTPPLAQKISLAWGAHWLC